jgi:hypothetical protein
MRYSIHTQDEVLGRVWLDGNGDLAVDGDRERMGDLIDSMRSNRLGAPMSNEEFLATLPQRLNNGYIWAQPEPNDAAAD